MNQEELEETLAWFMRPVEEIATEIEVAFLSALYRATGTRPAPQEPENGE